MPTRWNPGLRCSHSLTLANPARGGVVAARIQHRMCMTLSQRAQIGSNPRMHAGRASLQQQQQRQRQQQQRERRPPSTTARGRCPGASGRPPVPRRGKTRSQTGRRFPLGVWTPARWPAKGVLAVGGERLGAGGLSGAQAQAQAQAGADSPAEEGGGGAAVGL